MECISTGKLQIWQTRIASTHCRQTSHTDIADKNCRHTLQTDIAGRHPIQTPQTDVADRHHRQTCMPPQPILQSTCSDCGAYSDKFNLTKRFCPHCLPCNKLTPAKDRKATALGIRQYNSLSGSSREAAAAAARSTNASWRALAMTKRPVDCDTAAVERDTICASTAS